jgi:MraZ protein
LAAKWPKVAQSGESGSQVFTGEYRHTIDVKGRVAVPARFRSELAGVAHICLWVDGPLAIFPRAAWEELAAQASGLARVGDARAREFARSLFSTAYELELDSQGRVLLPAGLRELVGLGTDVVVVGLNTHVELWSPDRWASYSAGMREPDEFAARLSGLAI